jgi:hypothetical protein
VKEKSQKREFLALILLTNRTALFVKKATMLPFLLQRGWIFTRTATDARFSLPNMRLKIPASLWEQLCIPLINHFASP